MFNYDVLKVVPKQNLTLHVQFRDNVEGTIEFLPQKMFGVLTQLKKHNFFKQVFVEKGVVRWPGEIDISPESLYEAVVKECQIGCVKGHKKKIFKTC